MIHGVRSWWQRPVSACAMVALALSSVAACSDDDDPGAASDSSLLQGASSSKVDELCGLMVTARNSRELGDLQGTGAVLTELAAEGDDADLSQFADIAAEAARLLEEADTPNTDVQANRARATRLNIATERLELACIEAGFDGAPAGVGAATG